MKRVRADQEAQRSLAALIRKIFDTKICPKMDAPPDPTPEKLKNRILFEITGRSNDDFSLGPQSRVFIKKMPGSKQSCKSSKKPLVANH